MNQVLPTGARKEARHTMTNAEPTENTAVVAEQGAPVASEKASSKKGTSKKPAAPKAKKGASNKASKPAAKKEPKPASKKASKAKDGPARDGSKKQIVIDLLRRKDGATMAEITKATNWQNHSIRGFVSGTLMKKMELPVASFKNDQGERCYRIEK